jgi:hypothetical protein
MTTTFILVEENGFGLPHTTGTVLGIATGAAASAAFLYHRHIKARM